MISATKSVCDAGGVVAPPGVGAGTGGGSGTGSGGNTNMPGTPATSKNGASELIPGASSNKCVYSGIFALAAASVALFL
jgi:hypothetical protein